MIKEIMCPDCGMNYISIERYNSGLPCISCSHRKSWAERQGRPYVKFKDLTFSEQQERLKIKNTAARYKTESSQRSIKSSSVNKSSKGARKYPEEFYEFIKENAGANVSVRELYGKLNTNFPDICKTYSVIDLGKYISARKLPFRRLTRSERTDLIMSTKNKNKKRSLEEKIDCVEINSLVEHEDEKFKVNSVENVIKSDNIEFSLAEQPTKIYCEDDPEYSEEARFAPIIKEVRDVLNTKFEEVGCSLGYDFSVDDYIKAFTVIRYLINNYETIAIKRNDQWDIANGYQTDVVHEMEQIVSKPGDTYFQDKCHVLRDIRRGFEIDGKCMEILKPFLSSMTSRTNDLTTIIDRLNVQKNKQEDFRYVPNVDKTMISKYTWAQEENPCSSKLMQRTLLSTNSKNNKKSGKPVFIASCFLSGGGYGVFKKWVREVSYDTREEAQKAIDLELDDIKRKNKNILVSNFSLYRKS